MAKMPHFQTKAAKLFFRETFAGLFQLAFDVSNAKWIIQVLRFAARLHSSG